MEKKDYYNCTFAFNESSPSQLMSSSSSPSNLIEKDLLSSFMDSKYEDTGVDVNLSLGPPELPVKKCQMCGETDTPLWRNGPHGPKTACNACGIRFRKTKEKLNTDLILALPRPKKQRCSRNKELKHA